MPEPQHLAVGDRVPDSEESGVSFFTVARIEANRALVLHSHTQQDSILILRRAPR